MAAADVLRPRHDAARTPVPPFKPEHVELRESMRGWVARELAPHAEQWEREHWMPDEAFHKCAAQGWFDLKFGDDDLVAAAVWAEEMAGIGSGGAAASLGAHSEIALPPIHRFGTDEQKARWLAPGVKAEKLAALAITEPDAGSDVAGIRTRATRVDGGWLVSGSKCYITNGIRADIYVTAVKTTAEGGHHGLSFLVIEAPAEGLTREPLEKLGWHASDTGLITFDEVFVPEENLLGRENQGFYLIMANFQWERLLMALGAVAGASFALEKTLRYVGERHAFGRPIGKFQSTRHKLAGCATRIEAGRALNYHCLRLMVAGQDAVREVTQAKLYSQRMALECMDTFLQLHGGAGYMVEYGIERAYRDARLGPIGGGTDEIMRDILAKTYGL